MARAISFASGSSCFKSSARKSCKVGTVPVYPLCWYSRYTLAVQRSIIDFCFAPRLAPPISCSQRDIMNSDLRITGFAPSPYSLFISIALIWLCEVAEILIISPPRALTSCEYSRSGSIIITSALEERMMFSISPLAAKDLPPPDTPRIKELPFSSCLRSAIIIFLLITFCP